MPGAGLTWFMNTLSPNPDTSPMEAAPTLMSFSR